MILAIAELPQAYGLAVWERVTLILGERPASGTIYMSLARLEKDGLAVSSHEPSSGNRRRIYQLTQEGQELLGSIREKRESLRQIVWRNAR